MSESIAVGECSVHGLVTEKDGVKIQFPTVAECHCGKELERATVADAEEVAKYE